MNTFDNKYDVCTLQTDNKNLSNTSGRRAPVKMPNDKNYLNVGEGFTRWLLDRKWCEDT